MARSKSTRSYKRKAISRYVSKVKSGIRRARYARTTLPSPMGGKYPFPPTTFVKMPYVENITSLQSSGVSGKVYGSEVVFRLSSVFDPQFAIGGHQPYGRDILAQIWNKYKVYGVKIDCRWSDAGADGTCCGMMINASDDATTLTGLDCESANEKPNIFTVMVNNTGSQYKKWSKYFSIASIDGLTKSQFNGDFTQYSATNTTDPTLSPFLRVAVANMADNVNVKCNLNVKLTYYVKWFDRKTLPQS